MADTTITQKDIDALASKLDELGSVLSSTEQSILLAVFKLAAQSISSRLQGSGAEGGQTESGAARVGARSTGTLAANKAPSALSSGFKGAFQALGNSEFTLRDKVGDVASGVGIGVVW